MKAKVKSGSKRRKFWNFLQHNGPVFPPSFKRLPRSIKFKYNSKAFRLSLRAEEIASYFAKFLGHKLTKNQIFVNNFFSDWRRSMNPKERRLIKNLRHCDFRSLHTYLKSRSKLSRLGSSKRSQLHKDDEKIVRKHGFCKVDGRMEKIANFKLEPPGLFIGRGRHPLMGRVKRRIAASDVVINCSKNARIPKPPTGQRWKAVIHNNSVSWLASWNDPLHGTPKYIYLDASSMQKTQREAEKYEFARQLNKNYKRISSIYMRDLSRKDAFMQQCAIAIYFIDKLGLRAGNEKSGDSADTVGCCSLRVEHLKLRRVGRNYQVSLNFLGKDSIRFKREVKVPSRVYTRLAEILKGKGRKGYVFDLLTTSTLNKRLQSLMNGLTARVFRTRLASYNFEKLLQKTPTTATLEEKLNFYKEINARVAILCNHKRTVPTKAFRAAMIKLEVKIKQKKSTLQKLQRTMKYSVNDDRTYRQVSMRLQQLQESIRSLESKRKLRELCNQVSLTTSKLNYLDPRITVNWCRKNDVPLEKIYGKAVLHKFRWALKTRRFKF